jgi:hypothetical protein
MLFQIEASTALPAAPLEPLGINPDAVNLLREILDVQREQLNLLRVSTAAHDMGARWRAFLARWQEDFPGLSDACKNAMPILERTYGKLIADLTEHLCQDGDDALDNDFSLQEFLDRYGHRVLQLGTILSLVAPLAEAGSQGESK